MKPISQATTEAIVQFSAARGKFYLKTKHKWFLFRWWKPVGRISSSWGDDYFVQTYWDTKEDAENAARHKGLTLV